MLLKLRFTAGIVANDNWSDSALCKDKTEIFFPDHGRSTNEAVEICKSCTVAETCLGYALIYNEEFGVWGGMSYRARKRLPEQLRQRYLDKYSPYKCASCKHGLTRGMARRRQCPLCKKDLRKAG